MSVNIRSFWGDLKRKIDVCQQQHWVSGVHTLRGSTETTWYQIESKLLQFNYSCNLLHLYADLGKKIFLFSQPITATIIQFYARHDWLTNTAATTLQSGAVKLNLTEWAVLWRDFMHLNSSSHIMGISRWLYWFTLKGTGSVTRIIACILVTLTVIPIREKGRETAVSHVREMLPFYLLQSAASPMSGQSTVLHSTTHKAKTHTHTPRYTQVGNKAECNVSNADNSEVKATV